MKKKESKQYRKQTKVIDREGQDNKQKKTDIEGEKRKNEIK